MTRTRNINELIARAIAPDAWREYDKGFVTYQGSYELRDSQSAAARVYDALKAAGALQED